MFVSILSWLQPNDKSKGNIQTAMSSESSKSALCFSKCKTLSVCWMSISHSSNPDTSLVKVFYFASENILRVCNLTGRCKYTVDFEEDVSTIVLINYIHNALTRNVETLVASPLIPTFYHITTNIGHRVDVSKDSENLPEILVQTLNIIRCVRRIKIA